MTKSPRPQVVSTLGRPLNPSYIPNLLILIVTPVAAVIGVGVALAQGSELSLALVQGFWTLLGVFLAWALARELDPDHDYSAFVAVVVFAPLLWFLPDASAGFGIAALFLILQLARMVSRVVGPPLQLTDSVVVFAMVIIVALFDNWMLALVAVLAFLVDAVLEDRLLRHVGFAVLCGVVFGIRFALSGIPEFGGSTFPYLVGVAFISIIYVVTIAMTHTLTSLTDIEGYKLSVIRVRAAMLVPLVAGILLLIIRGDAGFIALLPAWAAMLGVSLFRLPITLWKIRKQRQETNA